MVLLLINYRPTPCYSALIYLQRHPTSCSHAASHSQLFSVISEFMAASLFGRALQIQSGAFVIPLCRFCLFWLERKTCTLAQHDCAASGTKTVVSLVTIVITSKMPTGWKSKFPRTWCHPGEGWVRVDFWCLLDVYMLVYRAECQVYLSNVGRIKDGRMACNKNHRIKLWCHHVRHTIRAPYLVT